MNASIATVLGFPIFAVTPGTITGRPGTGSTKAILAGELTIRKTEVFLKSACPSPV